MDALDAFSKIAPHLANPLVLVGFVLLLFYGVHWTLIKSGILQPVSARQTGLIVRTLLRYGFVVALLMIVAGFGSNFHQVWRSTAALSQEVERSKERIKELLEQQKIDRETMATLRAALDRVAGAGPIQGVTEALAAFAVGDSTGAMAIIDGLLQRKLVEAEAITSEAEAARKEAAKLARYLGAFASLNDTKAALAAYRRAVELDPDDVGTWISIGQLERRSGNLAKAENVLKHARELARIDGQKLEESTALNELGRVINLRGDVERALQAYDDALDIREQLVKSDPSDPERQRDVSVTLERIGDVLLVQFELRGALKVYEQAHTIAQQLATSDPNNPRWQRDLSFSLNDLGDVLKALNYHDRALDAYEEALTIRQRLVDASPNNLLWLRDLSVSWTRIGEARKAKRDFAAALEAFEQDLTIAEKLVSIDPGNAEWQRDLSVSWMSVAHGRRTLGDFAGAFDAYDKAREIVERLVAEIDSENVEWQRDLSVIWNRIGDAREAQGDLAGALEAFEQDLAIAEKLVSIDRGNAAWQRDLNFSHWRIAKLRAKMSSP